METIYTASRERELRQIIEQKRQEQYLATRDLVNKAEARVSNAEKQLRYSRQSSKTQIHLKTHIDLYYRLRDTTYKIADRNRRIYEYEIDCLNDEIKLLYEKDPKIIQEIHLERKRKSAYYKLLSDHTGTPRDVRRYIYERSPNTTGEYQLGLLEQTQKHMRDMLLSEYEMENISKIYKRLLCLFDLGLKDCILDFYELTHTMPDNSIIKQFVYLCETTYLIPDQICRFRLRARLLKQILCDDMICEIFSYLHNGRLCDRKTIDSVVYE